MGLPMYVSPSLSKRQLPSKQPTSPPFTPQVEEDFEEAYQNSRTSAFSNDISEPQSELPQRSQRSRRSTSLPYNLVQQQIQRLQLHQLHRTRTQQISSSNLASRRGLHSAHHLSLNHRAQMQAAQARRQNESTSELSRNAREERSDYSQDEMLDFSFDDFVSSLDNHNHNYNHHHNNNSSNSGNSNNSNNSSSSINHASRNNFGGTVFFGVPSHNDNDDSNNAALDNVIRINLLRQISRQQQESRAMRSSSRHHRSTTGHSSGRSSRMTSSNVNVERRRDDLVQRGIDILPSSSSSSVVRHPLPEPTLLFPNENPTTSLPPLPRLSAWHSIRRGANLSNDPRTQPPVHRRSSFVDDFYSEVPHSYDDDHHMSRILSPVPRRYARFAATLASLPVRNGHDLLDTNDIDNRSSNLDRDNEPVRTEQRGSASGEVC